MHLGVDVLRTDVPVADQAADRNMLRFRGVLSADVHGLSII